MRPHHIAMFTVPLPGHIYPSLEIIRELAARGHRVSYAITEEYAHLIRDAGAEPVVYSTAFPPASSDERPKDELAGAALFLEEAIHVSPQLATAYDSDQPDLILHDFGGYPGPVLAHRWGVPAVQIAPVFVPWKGYEKHISSLRAARLSDPRGRAYYDRFHGWLAHEGIDADPDFWLAKPRRAVVPIPKELQPHAEDVDEQIYTFVGPCLREHADDGSWQRPRDAERVLLISLGSAYNHEPKFYRQCYDAFGDLDGWHVVLNIGQSVDGSELGEAPRNFSLHRWLPQLSVLQRTDVFVTHAGMGSTVQGIWCGVPMLAVPQALDQFVNADSIARLGIGHKLSDPASVPALREAVLDLASNGRIAANVEGLRQQVRATGGTRRAVEIIEGELLRLSQPRSSAS